MWKKFFMWFVYFGASFLVSDVFGWTEQGKAFLYINIGASVAIIVMFILILLFAGVVIKEKLLAGGISFVFVMYFAFRIIITLFATWIATKLFDIDFFTIYQIMTFGACLATKESNSKKE